LFENKELIDSSFEDEIESLSEAALPIYR
jgi:hypothetical protein